MNGPRESIVSCVDHGKRVGEYNGQLRHVFGPDTGGCASSEFYVQTRQRIDRSQAMRIQRLGPGERDVISAGTAAMISHNTGVMNAWRLWAEAWLRGEDVWYFEPPE